MQFLHTALLSLRFDHAAGSRLKQSDQFCGSHFEKCRPIRCSSRSSYKSLSLANRVVMAPMTRSRSPNGTPGEDVAAYYRRRTEGGVGLIVTEGTTVDRPGASNNPRRSEFL